MTESETISALDKLYEQYLAIMKKLEKSRASVQGLWSGMMGGGPGSDSCNDVFSQGVQRTILDMENPDSVEALSVMRYVLRRGLDPDCCRTAEVMLTAIHGYLLPLVHFLKIEDAAAFMDEYNEAYSKGTQLPSQRKLVESLREKIGK